VESGEPLCEEEAELPAAIKVILESSGPKRLVTAEPGTGKTKRTPA
jgi:hypothetical protein